MKVLLFPVIVLFVVLSCLCASVTAQTNWLRLESDSKDFSVAIPPGYQILTDKDGYQIRRLISRKRHVSLDFCRRKCIINV